VGWLIMGVAIGASAGIYERSRSKMLHGLAGGAVGGGLGGLLFFPIQAAASGSGIAARATAFVILGISIGALIGLTHVVLKGAWLTVLDGFRPGRELILSQPVTVLGRGDHLPLPLLGYAGRDLESEHAKITRLPDGTFAIEDNRSRLGTMLNGQPIRGVTTLSDGDLIKLGGNIVRFNLPHGRSGRVAAVVPRRSAAGTGAIAPPPPPPGRTGPAEIPTAQPPGHAGPSSPGPRIPPPPPPPQ
jgi:hypothetical protein